MHHAGKKVLSFLRNAVKTLRLALPKLGVGWMFAILTIDFNRIAIVELGIAAVLITAMLSLHYFLSPFQVISGRFADKHPIFGLRRTPYLLIGGFVGSLIFVALPRIVHAVADGSAWAIVSGFLLLVVYGIAIAFMGDAHHSLIAEVTEPRARGGVISVVWTFTILSSIISAIVFNIVSPEYSLAAMQRLYNLTPFVVVISILVGTLGIEKRLKGDQLKSALEQSRKAAPEGNAIQAAINILRNNRQARGFFIFVFVAIFSIFLQDNILEVFGAEVFKLSIEETRQFQPMWGGGVLVGMLLMGMASTVFGFSKRTITIVGCVGTAVGMAVLAMAALTRQVGIVFPALVMMGLFTGFFNVGALSMMMDMTVEGATGLFMGLWGMAQAFGNGVASFSGGALHTGLIESGLLGPNVAYGLIYGIEAVGMVVAAVVMWRISVNNFRESHAAAMSASDALRAMEAGAIA
ncbi:MAG: BCD family MFS transporter [Ardenticatenaceae bacterium]|nr:BCD family MFS transporter [Ardenticatenaceae bacterium]MCB8948592.1 BCD family MFS transporter [Ardenticatenaceae bacterium]